jgi:hypothetical protein
MVLGEYVEPNVWHWEETKARPQSGVPTAVDDVRCGGKLFDKRAQRQGRDVLVDLRTSAKLPRNT